MSLIKGVIGQDQLELSVFKLEKMLYLTVYTLVSTNNQSTPNLVKIYMTIRESQIGSIMGLRITANRVICPWIDKMHYYALVYRLTCTNINQSATNLFKIYMAKTGFSMTPLFL